MKQSWPSASTSAHYVRICTCAITYPEKYILCTIRNNFNMISQNWHFAPQMPTPLPSDCTPRWHSFDLVIALAEEVPSVIGIRWDQFLPLDSWMVEAIGKHLISQVQPTHWKMHSLTPWYSKDFIRLLVTTCPSHNTTYLSDVWTNMWTPPHLHPHHIIHVIHPPITSIIFVEKCAQVHVTKRPANSIPECFH